MHDAPTESAGLDPEIEREINALLEEFGDPRAVIRALLHDLGEVIADRNRSVSTGYVRSSVIKIKRRTG